MTANPHKVIGSTPVAVCDGKEYHGVIPPNRMNPGLKELNGPDGKRKPRWELLPFDAAEEVVRVLTAGAEKYDDNSWQAVDSNHYIGAMLRHIKLWLDGEPYDKDLDERGCRVSHLACVATNALFLLWQEMHKQDNE